MRVEQSEQLVSDLTLGQLLRLMRRVAREERRGECFLESDGSLVFYRESDYARYLKTQSGKLPSEVNACFVDAEGFRYRFSDWTPTAGKRQQVAATRQRKPKRVPAAEVWQQLRQLGVKA